MGHQLRGSLRIVSGGQTGVDRAALDAALKCGYQVGGWCPRGRVAEDGVIDAKYGLRETTEVEYAIRTERNVLDSDGTLILHEGPLSGGTRYTKDVAIAHQKPYLMVDLSEEVDQSIVIEWLNSSEIRTLNVAGPRESGCPGIYQRARLYLCDLLRQIGR